MIHSINIQVLYSLAVSNVFNSNDMLKKYIEKIWNNFKSN